MKPTGGLAPERHRGHRSRFGQRHGAAWGRLRGGQVYGRWPGLGSDRLDRGRSAVTTDRRLVVDEIRRVRCGAPDGTFAGLRGRPLGVAHSR